MLISFLEDVELLLTPGTPYSPNDEPGHYVTLFGFNWADANADGVVQPGENATLSIIDPATGGAPQVVPVHFWNFGGPGSALQTDYGNGQFNATFWVSMAVSESPVPEPAAFPVALGLLALGSRVWLRRRT